MKIQNTPSPREIQNTTEVVVEAASMGLGDRVVGWRCDNGIRVTINVKGAR